MAEIASGTTPATSETSAAIQNLVSALPGVATTVITSKANEATAKLQAQAATAQAKAEAAKAEAEKAKAQTAGILATVKQQSPWLVPLAVLGIGTGVYFMFFRKKNG